MSSGDLTIQAATDPETEVVVDALVKELESFAFERERVLAKLDIRSAQLARRIAREVRVVLRGLAVCTDESARASVLETLGDLLGEAHRLLEGELATLQEEESRTQTGERPIEELRDAARRVMQTRPTRPAMETIPSVVPFDDRDEDETAVGQNETIARRVVWERSGNRILGR